jgi:fatty-acyl-CoA synthase
VILLDEVPLTPEGKIFKPALHWDAIRRVSEAGLEALDDVAESLKVVVIEDKVESILTRFTIRCRVEIA